MYFDFKNTTSENQATLEWRPIEKVSLELQLKKKLKYEKTQQHKTKERVLTFPAKLDHLQLQGGVYSIRKHSQMKSSGMEVWVKSMKKAAAV